MVGVIGVYEILDTGTQAEEVKLVGDSVSYKIEAPEVYQEDYCVLLEEPILLHTEVEKALKKEPTKFHVRHFVARRHWYPN